MRVSIAAKCSLENQASLRMHDVAENQRSRGQPGLRVLSPGWDVLAIRPDLYREGQDLTSLRLLAAVHGCMDLPRANEKVQTRRRVSESCKSCAGSSMEGMLVLSRMRGLMGKPKFHERPAC